MLDAAELAKRIKNVLGQDADVDVRDTTGTGDHFEARVAATQFAGRSMVEQHQMVYAAFRDELATGELHALALKTEVKR